MKALVKKTTAEQIEERNTEPVSVKKQSKKTSDLIPTGCTLLNLACSDNYKAGFGLGKIINIIGDTSAGKTFLALTIFAEVVKESRFDNFVLAYDDVEEANEFDIEYLFGKKTFDRIDQGFRSFTIEDLYDNIYYLLDQGHPFIYVLDSFDALTSEAGVALAEENRKLRAKDKPTKGSYGDGKPKAFSDFCKLTVGKLAQNNSLIIIISQTRDNIGFGAQFKPKTRSGGKALGFYSTHELWLSVAKARKELDLKIGNDVMVKLTKNKMTGKHRAVYFPIYYDYGIDDIQACVDYLMDRKHWKGTGAKVNAVEFEVEMSVKNLILYIEENNFEGRLRKIVSTVWLAHEEAVRMDHRKRKY